MKWIMGIFICYMLLLPYVATMNTIYGYAWIRQNPNLFDEYLILLSLYYTLCLFGHTIKAIKKLVDKEQ